MHVFGDFDGDHVEFLATVVVDWDPLHFVLLGHQGRHGLVLPLRVDSYQQLVELLLHDVYSVGDAVVVDSEVQVASLGIQKPGYVLET